MTEASRVSVAVEVTGLDKARGDFSKFEAAAKRTAATVEAAMTAAESSVASLNATIAQNTAQIAASFAKIDALTAKGFGGLTKSVESIDRATSKAENSISKSAASMQRDFNALNSIVQRMTSNVASSLGSIGPAAANAAAELQRSTQALTTFEAVSQSMMRSASTLEGAILGIAEAQKKLNDSFNSSGGGGGKGNPFKPQGDALDELRAKYNPLYEIGLRYKQQVEGIRAAHVAGAIEASEMAIAIERAGNVATMSQNAYLRMDDTLKIVGGSAKLTAHQMTNLGYQANDVVTMFLMGASPFQIIASQAGQVVQALGDGPGGMRGSLVAIKDSIVAGAKAIGPWGFAMAGVVGGAAALAFAVSDKVGPVEDIIKRQEEAVKDLRDAYGQAGDSSEEYAKRASQSLSFKANEDYVKDLERIRDRVTEIGNEIFGGRDNQRRLTLPSFEPIRKAFADLQKSAKDDIPDFIAFDNALASILEKNPESGWIGNQLGDAAREALDAAAGFGKLQQILEQNIEVIDPAKRAVLEFIEAAEGLRELGPSASAIEKINDAFDDAMVKANAAGDAMTALFFKQRALAENRKPLDEMFSEGKVELATAGMNDLDAAIARANAKYDTLAENYAGDADAQRLINELRAQGIAIARADDSAKKAEEATRKAEQLAAQQERQVEAARKATFARQEGYTQAVEAIQLELDTLGKSEGMIRALTQEAQWLAAAKRVAGENGVVSEAELTRIREAAAEVGRLTDELAARTAANTAVDTFFPFEAAAREAEKLQGYLNDTSLGLTDIQRRALELQIDQEFKDAAEAVENLNAKSKKASKDIGEAFLKNVGDVFADVFGQATRDGESFFSSIMRGFAGLGNQLSGAGFKTLSQQLFGIAPDNSTRSAAGLGGLIGQASSFATQQASTPVVASSVAVPTARPQYIAEAAAASSGSMLKYARQFNSNVDGRLLKIMEVAATRMPGYSVQAISGLASRPGNKGFHPRGQAVDVSITNNSTGYKYGNYQNAADFRVYEQFAQIAKGVQQELFPALESLFTFGGYFKGPKGHYGALDSMHFDIGGANRMQGGSWANGLNAQQRRYFPGVQSVGIGSSSSGYTGNAQAQESRIVARGVEQGVTDAARRNPGLLGGAPLTPGFHYQNANGDSVNHVGITRGQQAFGAIGSGIGIFSQGYQSGNPLMGGVSGAMGGFQAAQALGFAGPLGAIAGAGLGILGGIFGGRAQRREEHKKKAEAWEQVRPQYEAFHASLSGEGQGDLRAYITEQWGQLSSFMKTGGDAWKMGTGNSTAQFNSTGKLLFEGFLDMINEFQDNFNHMVEDMSSGQGLQGAFARGRNATKELADQIKKTRDDVDIAFGNIASIDFLNTDIAQQQAKDTEARRAEAAQRFNDAAAEYALSMLYTAETVSEVQKTIDGLRGTAAGLQSVLEDTGRAADVAAQQIGDRLNQALAEVARTLENDVRDRLEQLNDRGHFTAVRDFLVEFEGIQKDFAAAGADTSNLGELFSKELQAIVDNAELTGDAFNELIKAFPQLNGAIKEFNSLATRTAEQIKASLQSYSDRYFEATTDTSDQAGALTRFDRYANRERQELLEAEATAEEIAALEKALGAERLAIIRDFNRQQVEESKRLKEEATSYLEGFARNIKEYLDGLETSAASPLSNRDKRNEAEKQFNEQLALARKGDRDALDSITSYADRFLDAEQQYNASGPEFKATFERIKAALELLPKQVRPEDLIKQAIEEATDTTVDALTAMQDSLRSAFASGPEATALALSSYFNKLDTSLDGLLSFDELRAGLNGIATDAQIRTMMNVLDANGDGQISQLELIKGSNNQQNVILSQQNTLLNAISNLTEATRAQTAMAADRIGETNRIIGSVNYLTNLMSEHLGELRHLTERVRANLAQQNAMHKIPFFRDGGRVTGPGTGTSDSVTARVSNGEFVVREAIARMVGYDKLERMNATGQLPGEGRVTLADMQPALPSIARPIGSSLGSGALEVVSELQQLRDDFNDGLEKLLAATMMGAERVGAPVDALVGIERSRLSEERRQINRSNRS